MAIHPNHTIRDDLMKSKFIVCLVVLNLLFFLHTSSCLAANPYRIALKNVPMSVTNDHFYVKTVIDGRMDKSGLGTVQCGIFNKKVPADFKGDFINVIQSYLETTFKMAETKVPIVVKINILRVVEEEAIEGEISRAEAKMAFYKMNEAKLGKVYETEAYVPIRVSLCLPFPVPDTCDKFRDLPIRQKHIVSFEDQ